MWLAVTAPREKVEGTAVTSTGLKTTGHSYQARDGSLESLAILGLGSGGQLGEGSLGEEPWMTVI